MSGARTSLSGWLARMGFADVPRAERELARLGITAEDHPVLAALAQAADPDLALAGLAQIADRDPLLTRSLAEDPAFRARLCAVLGVSRAVADHLVRHPEDLSLLCGLEASRRPDVKAVRAEFLRAVAADPDDAEPMAGQVPQALPGSPAPCDPAEKLAAAYHRRVAHLAARDLAGDATVDEVAEELADLADAVLEAALAIARAELPPDAAPVRFAVVAMGKCGARELNYASDIDVIFLAEPPGHHPGSGEPNGEGGENATLKTATKLASGLIRACERVTPEGSLFPVDPNLRPEGRQGPLVRSLASHLAYYERWAKTWEFQALLKARPAAGDLALGKRYTAALTPLVWQASRRENFVEGVQAMRRRVVDTLPKNMAGRELKLGPGGLRDIEFAVQLLQLVHGRDDDRLRVPATLPALAALADGGYVGRADAEDLAQAYRFLRQTEHLLQIYQLRRTHTLPTDPSVLRRLGRALAFAPQPVLQNVRVVPLEAPVTYRGPGGPGLGGTAVPPEQAFTEAWSKTAQRVRRLHEKLFYRPLLDAVAKLPSGAARLTPEAARARLEALGYRDPVGALRHIEALTTGLRRRAEIQRTLLPVLLGWFADAAEPDAGLLAFRQVSEALGDSPWFLRLLRDETKTAERMAYVLASSRYATGLLLRAPEAVAIFADDAELVPKAAEALRAEMMAAARRHAGDAEQAAVAVRSLRRRELFRVAAASVLGLIELAETGEALTAITTASLDAVLAATIARVEAELDGPLPTRFAVIAMGRYGGHESGFGSDADVIFVHDPLPGPGGSGPGPSGERRASDAAQAVGTELRRLLQIPAPDPPLLVDADLRPEGKQGPLVRSLAACKAYYARRAAPWESQALLRAEAAPSEAAPSEAAPSGAGAGDASVGAAFIALADRYRYPAGGLSEAATREIRRIKARVEAERIPRGTDRALHLKLGPGGLSDVEWTVQLLQLRHGHAVEGLRTTRTLAALDAAVEAGLVAAPDAAALRDSWSFAARIRNAIMLVRGRPGDTFPVKHDELTAVARLLGYRPTEAAHEHQAGRGGASSWSDTPAAALEEDYRRTARRARKVMDRLFYG
ncbi:MAG TPA: bifunctional [glutamine synthetase] adenylyltransferase/[glutamine synthetase]-adenylyl-L-tyrosine phosphorylase [Trebonia sp.]|nr:bifunctional [glutamine synthetase] adenylyltransferase/[glutamine synthetase]-adenylyl-L-tyrosine phosphorylase [Trebonia sp.]